MTTQPLRRTFIVQLDVNGQKAAAAFDEFVSLVQSAALNIVGAIRVNRRAPDAKFFVGKGKLQELAIQIAEADAELVVFNHALSAAQNRNLELELCVRVIDRISLILDIFAQRAQSYEGRLQVELAQLQHLNTRLIRGWTHLERQKGGIGLRGPGETQLETDRRLITRRIKIIHQRLEKVRKQRTLSRQRRRRNAVPVVSLVGYTNAGKSTLFNYLTGAKVKSSAQLFATLDPVLRRCRTLSGNNIILTDTVGFIQSLPHQLIAAFQATLAEVKEADLLLHVIDASQAQHRQHIAEVNQVISLINAEGVPQIEVYNKIDQSTLQPAQALHTTSQHNTKIWLSSLTGEGVDLLLAAIDQYLEPKFFKPLVIGY